MNGFDIVGEGVPGTATGIDDRVIVDEHLEAQKALSQIQPDPFDRIEFRAVGRQNDQGDVLWQDELLGAMPAGLIEHHDDMDVFGHGFGERLQKDRHGCGVGRGQDEAEGIAGFGSHGAEDIGRFEAPITDACSALAFWPPAMTKATFLTNSGFVLEVQTDRFVRMSPGGSLDRLAELFF